MEELGALSDFVPVNSLVSRPLLPIPFGFSRAQVNPELPSVCVDGVNVCRWLLDNGVGPGRGAQGLSSLKLGMVFLLPLTGCSMCKRIMPHFQKAATQVRGHFVSKALGARRAGGSDLGPGWRWEGQVLNCEATSPWHLDCFRDLSFEGRELTNYCVCRAVYLAKGQR